MRPRLLLSTAVVAAVALTAACGSSSSSSSSSSESSSGSAAVSTEYQEEHAGGTLRLTAHAAAGSIDPKVNYTLQYWQLFQAMYDGLLAFKKVGGEESFEVVPDLAEAMPEVSADGTSYTFTLRDGIKFSTGADVTTADVAASFKRIFLVSTPTAGTFYNGIVGAEGCLADPATCDLSAGVVADEAAGTVTINLVAPDPEFPYKLAVPHAVIVPADSPPTDAGDQALPTTGPYMVESYDPNTKLRLVRNPHFTEWSREAQPQGYPDVIEETFGLTVEAEVTAVQNGDADWLFDPPPADRLAEIGTEYADQVHVNDLTAMWYLAMNTNIAPFDDVKARQAINWAVDRAAAVQLYGGDNLAAPVCTFLPPGFPGHEDDCQYTAGGGDTWTGPDVEKAKQLVQESGTAGQEVGIVTSDDEVNQAIGEYVQSMLTEIGYKATLKPISSNIQFTYIQNTDNDVQLSLTSWYQDYPAASNFLNVLASCASFHPGSDSSINIAGFCDPEIDAQMQQALVTGQTDTGAADALWTQIDQAVMAEAPIAPLFTPKIVDFTSERVGNYQFSKQFYMLVSQLWVQ